MVDVVVVAVAIIITAKRYERVPHKQMPDPILLVVDATTTMCHMGENI